LLPEHELQLRGIRLIARDAIAGGVAGADAANPKAKKTRLQDVSASTRAGSRDGEHYGTE
jgi:hypothetical protein